MAKLEKHLSGQCQICRVCSDSYSLDHGAKCEMGHTLVAYPPPKLTATEAVEVQLRSALGGASFGSLGGVYGYGHADRLMDWARQQKLIEPVATDERIYREGAVVTERGHEWLEKFGDSEAAATVAASSTEDALHMAEVRARWDAEAAEKAAKEKAENELYERERRQDMYMYALNKIARSEPLADTDFEINSLRHE